MPAPPPALQALVDTVDEVRRVVSFKRLTLTDFKIDIPRLAKKSVLKKALAAAGGWHTHGFGPHYAIFYDVHTAHTNLWAASQTDSLSVDG